MEITLTTPALLFPAISLLFLAYTNKFLTLAALIRTFYQEYIDDSSRKCLPGQIANMRKRLHYIKTMQGLGILSFIFCVLTMMALYVGMSLSATILFGLSLLFLLASLIVCGMEVKISVDALELQIANLK